MEEKNKASRKTTVVYTLIPLVVQGIMGHHRLARAGRLSLMLLGPPLLSDLFIKCLD